MAQMILPEAEANRWRDSRWRDRFRQDTHPVVGTASFTTALVAVGVVSIFVPFVGVLAIAVVVAILMHGAITAAVKR